MSVRGMLASALSVAKLPSAAAHADTQPPMPEATEAARETFRSRGLPTY